MGDYLISVVLQQQIQGFFYNFDFQNISLHKFKNTSIIKNKIHSFLELKSLLSLSTKLGNKRKISHTTFRVFLLCFYLFIYLFDDQRKQRYV